MKPSEEHGAALYVNSEYLDVEARDTGRVGQQHGMYETVRDAGGGGATTWDVRKCGCWEEPPCFIGVNNHWRTFAALIINVISRPYSSNGWPLNHRIIVFFLLISDLATYVGGAKSKIYEIL